MLDVAVLADHEAVLAGLRRLIDAAGEVEVVGAAATESQLARQLAGRRPDVIVLDHDLGRGDGLAHCRRIKERRDAPAVVVYSAFAGPALALAARVARADAVVDKAAPIAALLSAIRRAARGERSLPPVTHDAYEAAVARLQDEDLPVFAMLLDGESPPGIAQAIGAEAAEIAWRTQRILGRLQPRPKGVESGTPLARLP